MLKKSFGSLAKLTPVEFHEGMYFKRDDKFAPLGYGNINGSKLRQAVYLVEKWIREKNIKGVISGSVSQSPQHAFISEICKHYGLECVIVHAKKNIDESPYLKLAKNNGSKFIKSKVGYAKTLGAIARKALEDFPGYEYLETNITLDEKINSWEDIESIHRIGSLQVKNIPEHIGTLIIPCGSCNSATSILYGLVKFPKPNIKKIILMGIGNYGSSNIGYVENRLKKICEIKNFNIKGFFDFKFKSDNLSKHNMSYYNLNGEGYCKYTDTMEEKAGGIEFHPRYEGKCIRYLKEYKEFDWNKNSLFWIVGGDIVN